MSEAKRTRLINQGNKKILAKTSIYKQKKNGRNRARTCDPLLVRQVLSQLSYAPIYSLTTQKRLELSTSGVTGRLHVRAVSVAYDQHKAL